MDISKIYQYCSYFLIITGKVILSICSSSRYEEKNITENLLQQPVLNLHLPDVHGSQLPITNRLPEYKTKQKLKYLNGTEEGIMADVFCNTEVRNNVSMEIVLQTC